MPFTHVGMYQARIACQDIAGETASVDYGAIPRVVFSDPEVAAVGLTEAQAGEHGVKLAAARIKLADAIARPWTYERDPRGELGLLADREREVLVGGVGRRPARGRVDPLRRARHQDTDAAPGPARHGRAVPNVQRGLPQGDREARAGVTPGVDTGGRADGGADDRGRAVQMTTRSRAVSSWTIAAGALFALVPARLALRGAARLRSR